TDHEDLEGVVSKAKDFSGLDSGRPCTDALPCDHTGDGRAVVDGRLPADRGRAVLAESAEVLGLADHTLEILMVGVDSGVDDGDLDALACGRLPQFVDAVVLDEPLSGPGLGRGDDRIRGADDEPEDEGGDGSESGRRSHDRVSARSSAVPSRMSVSEMRMPSSPPPALTA